MKFLTTPVIVVSLLASAIGVNSYFDYKTAVNHKAAIVQLSKELSHKQPVIDKATINGLTEQYDHLNTRVGELETNAVYMMEDVAKIKTTPQKVRTNVRPEYETDKAGRVVKNSDTFEDAMKNCDQEANLINFMTYGEPHPSCR